ncbi:hypothetical protein B0A48_00124 [Cryoendolithus antarcticus]|uniref:Uncharacterized protein n=1 Tax=Cryoendolithus antarcticus TaxID=1507870 RepID=A0A1V8TU81_9PEZI|nr:hypothetical protein B0A48_00124 [Cryoendolithus antarcticus]
MAALNHEQQAKLEARNYKPFDNSGTVPLNVPGAGCTVEAELDISERFRHGVNDFRQDRLVVREVAMLAVMDAITDKDSWTDKVFDETVVAKWRVEAMAMPLISEPAWEWCVLELRGKAKLAKEREFTTTLETGSACAKADARYFIFTLNTKTGIPIPTSRYGRRAQDGDTFSLKFQWRPAEVRFCNGSDTEVEITSYINNLHPVEHDSLYRTIGKIISKAIPMWNEILVKDYNNRYPLRITVEGAVFEPLSYPNELDDLVDADISDPTAFAAALRRARAYMNLPEQPRDINSALHFASDGDDEMPDFESDFAGEIDRALRWKHNRLRKIVHPEPGTDYTYEQWKEGKAPRPDPPKLHYLGGEKAGFHHEYQTVRLEGDFQEKGLQVIIKLAGIELTPEKPVFEGGNWHLKVWHQFLALSRPRESSKKRNAQRLFVKVNAKTYDTATVQTELGHQ